MLTEMMSWLMIFSSLLPVLLLTLLVMMDRRQRRIPSLIPLEHERHGLGRRSVAGPER